MVTQPSFTAIITDTAPSTNQTVVKGSTASGYGMSHQATFIGISMARGKLLQLDLESPRLFVTLFPLIWLDT
ncbi:hypothetical protein KIN20_005569 [Parelaphostrongylus tenuis]|uniref:Uncharacterized protein n=1 Tax=Parelaphostrongylus tenuis TaxID=148309 RepID=A0AAD5ML52_PARTN|nr:hypothetical protein KIN20_005358 [Parelaphostrongylus tenuis]KAJ1349894.1 hypothetical protein KIN20_005569 [Parelaphostrongylus tenuis]